MRKEQARIEGDVLAWDLPATLSPGFIGGLRSSFDLDGAVLDFRWTDDDIASLQQNRRLILRLPKSKFVNGAVGVAKFYGNVNGDDNALVGEVDVALEDRASIKLIPKSVSIRADEEILLKLAFPNGWNATDMRVKVYVNGKPLESDQHVLDVARPKIAVLTIRPQQKTLKTGFNDCAIELFDSLGESVQLESLSFTVNVIEVD